MNTRNLVFRLLAVLFAVSLVAAACGRDDEEAEEEKTEEEGGAPARAPGFNGKTIKVGVVTPQTGPVKIIGDPLTNGNKVYFDYVNEELGGVAGKYKIEMVPVDSKYDPNTGVQQYNAIKGDVTMFAQLLGTPIVTAALSQLKTDNIVAQPASLDAFWVREQNLLPIGAPYQIQAINALSWYTEENGTEQVFCTAVHDDPYGEAGQAGVDFAAEALGFEVKTTAQFKATDTEFTAAVQQLQSAGCEVIFLVATPTTAGGIMGQAATVGFTPRWIGQSPTWIGSFVQSPLLPYLQAQFTLVSEGTEWGDTSVAGMRQMLEHQQKYSAKQQPDIYFVFGYGEAWAVHQVLEAAVERGDLSRKGIIDAMNSIQTLEFGDLFGDYGWGKPEDRNPPRTSSIFRVDPEAPGGLRLVERGIESDAATKYEFPAG